MTAGVAQGGARVAYYYCPEVAGVIDPTTPAFTPIRKTGSTLAMSADSFASDELRPDRHQQSARRGKTSVAGDFDVELSFGTFDDLLAAAFCSAWATNVLKTSVLRPSFSILRRYLDVGVDTLFTGCQIGALSLACPLQEKITAKFSVIGLGESSYVVPAGATFADPTTTDFMTTLDGSLSLNGATFGCATDLNVSLSNNLESKYALFRNDAYAVRAGMIDVTGDFSAYIEDDTLKTAFRNDADQAFSIVMTDKASAGNTYTLALPQARFTSAQADSFSKDDLGIQQFNFTGLYNAAAGTELSLTRSA